MQRLAPFLVSGAAALAASLALNEGRLTASEWARLLLTLGLFTALVAGVPWQWLPRGWQVLAPIAAVGVIYMSRIFAGGPNSGLSLLLILPIVWTALYGTRWEVVAVVAVGVVALAAPVFTGADYPSTELARAVGLLAVAAPLAWALRDGQRRARTDALTGLPNRRAWDEALAQEGHRGTGGGAGASVVVIDIDHFKRFNDTHGHAAGDQLLRDAAASWSRALRRYDVLARVGGEEFGVLLPGTPPDRAMAVADRLRRAMPAGQTCSCGVAPLGGDAEKAFRVADDALYVAKARGRNRSVLDRAS